MLFRFETNYILRSILSIKLKVGELQHPIEEPCIAYGLRPSVPCPLRLLQLPDLPHELGVGDAARVDEGNKVAHDHVQLRLQVSSLSHLRRIIGEIQGVYV